MDKILKQLKETFQTMEETPFASFVVAPTTEGGYAATTRAADRGESGRIGLPGGKVDPGETGEEAAIREAQEEGWSIQTEPKSLQLIHTDYIDGKLIHWYLSKEKAQKLQNYKEQHRITPISVDLKTIAGSGYGNQFLHKYVTH